MRVLFITSRLPGNLRRGDELRAFEQLRHLSARHAITLLAFEQAAAASPLQAELEGFCERIIIVAKTRTGMAWRALAALAGPLPLQVAMNGSVLLQQRVRELIARESFDLVHLQLARLGQLLPALAPLPCVLDLIDALSLNMARRAAFDRGPLRLLARLEAPRLARYERRLCGQVAVAIVNAAPDREAIGTDIANLHVVNNGVDLAAFPFAAREAEARDVVFVGNLGYFPNVDAAGWLIREVLPRLPPSLDSTRVAIVGARPAATLRRLAAATPRMDLVGPVARVWPQLARAAVAVAPMRAGSGQQNKILEAMAAGTPMLATSLAAAGLGAIPGIHLLVADGAEAFAAALARLLHDRALAAQLARNARVLVEQRFSWAHSAEALEQHWLAAAQRHSDPAT